MYSQGVNMNAKEEFIKHVGIREVKAAVIRHGDYEIKHFQIIRPDRTLEEYEAFLKGLDYDYDNGFGGQNLFGVIWYYDGTWSERGEYDGSEWWEHQSLPEFSVVLQQYTPEEEN